jgi:hypothetical protein
VDLFGSRKSVPVFSCARHAYSQHQVLIANTSNRPVLRDTYFFKLDLADIIPTSVPNANLINSIARSIGLHDFYQVGLWNFCEGYINEYVLPLPPPPPLPPY